MPRWAERLDGFAASGGGTVFSLAFAVEAGGESDRVALVFEGVATSWVAELNGREVARGESMFARVEADVTKVLAGANTLVIRCLDEAALLAVERPKRPRQRWRTKVVENAGALRWVRTSILGRAPGFAPGPPAIGPWRPVWLVRERGDVVDDVALRPRLDGRDGVLGVAARVASDDVEVVVSRGGEEWRAPLSAGEVRVPDVARWWPHTHGEPALYDVALRVDGEDVGVGRTGFRTLGSDPARCVVNDVDIFARGVVWTPVAEDEVRSTLVTLRDAGFNMVRIPGIGVYESDVFWDACDELGLLVWQDFMFANMDYPIEDEGFRAVVVAEADAVLAAVGGRPSLALLCGGSEVEQQAAMFGADPAVAAAHPLFADVLPERVAAAGVDVPYVRNAPSGGALPFHPGAGVANYFGVGGYRRPLSDARTAGVRFASECLAFANVPDGAVSHSAGVMRDVGADWDFADVRDWYLRERYGVDRSHERYWDLSRQVSGEMMALVFGEWRRAASECGGGLVLWSRDLVPGSGWGLVDVDGRPKVALSVLARALRPRAVWIVDEGMNGLDVHVANDAAEPLEATLDLRVLAHGTQLLAESTSPISVPAHATRHVNAEQLLGRFLDLSYAYRFGPAAHDTVVAILREGDTILSQSAHFPLGPPTEPAEFALRATWRDGSVVVEAERVAWGVRVDVPGFVASDDGFVVVPGVPAVVALRPVGAAELGSGGRVTALNLIGEAPVGGPDVAA